MAFFVVPCQHCGPQKMVVSFHCTNSVWFKWQMKTVYKHDDHFQVSSHATWFSYSNTAKQQLLDGRIITLSFCEPAEGCGKYSAFKIGQKCKTPMFFMLLHPWFYFQIRMSLSLEDGWNACINWTFRREWQNPLVWKIGIQSTK